MNASEYQKKFRAIGSNTIENHYSQLLDYRRLRRSKEFSHHKWAWEGVSISDSEATDTDNEVENGKLTRDDEKDNEENVPHINGARANGESGDSDSEITERLKRLAVKKALQQVNDTSEQRSRKPRNPKNRMPIPRATKSPVRRSTDDAKEEQVIANRLFLPFGIGDRDGAATFNVRSDRDVRPSALRAKRRRQLEIEQRAAEKLLVPARQKKKNKVPSESHFEEKMKRETVKWQSEYAGRFPSYDLACYRRSLANLTPRPRSAFEI